MPFSPEKLRERMAARGYSQSELARRAGMQQPNIARLVSPGVRGARPSADVVQAIAAALRCRMEDLMTPIPKGGRDNAK
jgi:transcriptional regulator with XRE-family HTH domain